MLPVPLSFKGDTFLMNDKVCGYSMTLTEAQNLKGSNYDDVLTLWYGDYMTLPPENQRRTHNLEAYWISDKDIPEL